MIGKKTRENFEAKESNQYLYKNEGFKINNSKTPDIIHFPENINSIPCKLSDKTDEERNKEIQMQAQDAKQQLLALIKKKEQLKNKNKNNKLSKRGESVCNYLRFPNLL